MKRNEIEAKATELIEAGYLKEGNLRKYEAAMKANAVSIAESIVIDRMVKQYMVENNVTYHAAGLAVYATLK